MEGFVSSNQLRSKTLQFRKSFIPNFRRQGFNRIADHRHPPLSLQQSLDCQTDAVFRHHSKHYKFRSVPQTFNQLVRMATLKDIQRLFLQDDLLILEKIFGQAGVGVVFHANEILRQRLRNKLRARRALQAVRRKLLELRIIRRMKASMRNKKNFAAPR